MKMRPFSVGDAVFGVRDMEMSDKDIVLGYEESERGFVLVRFDDGIPRALPVASVERAADRKDEPRFRPQSKDLAEAKNLGDYLIRMGEAESGISQKEQHK
jgi:hypothetical protein